MGHAPPHAITSIYTRNYTTNADANHQCRWATHLEARQALFGYIEGYYNRNRMHSALGYLTPEQAEQRMTG
ncbi:integrase catalytic region [Sphingopyxis sp. FD7]|nr:integrase catalytic region [Sphingopyxis sp. FD7]